MRGDIVPSFLSKIIKMRKILFYYRLGREVYKMYRDNRLQNDADLGAEVRHEIRFRRK